MLGTGLTTVALALLAFELAGGDAGKVLGTALAIKMIAYVFFAPIAGAIAQKLPRRRFLVSLDAIRALFVACLPFVTQVWQIYVLIFLMQICSAGFTPAFQATIPDVLKSEGEYTKALALSRLAYDLESLASPALAAMALLFISFNGLFAVNAAAFVISAILIISTTLPQQSPALEADGVLSRISFGIRGLFGYAQASGAIDHVHGRGSRRIHGDRKYRRLRSVGVATGSAGNRHHAGSIWSWINVFSSQPAKTAEYRR